jgi:diguanylate cyclase (GGDEF)-like protein
MIGTYSLGLVGLSLLVAIAASYVAFALASHISATRGWAAAYWLAGGAVAMGTGIWSMHFVGMLALKLPIAVSYDLETTIASLALAIVVSGVALYVVAIQPSAAALAMGAVVMGLGIAAMHYTGMAAMNVAPPPAHDTGLVIASVVLAVAASALALALAFMLRGQSTTTAVSKRLAAAAAMGIGICAMHYTGMAAAEFAPGTICTTPGWQIDQHGLALAVTAAALLFLGATMLILTIDVRLAQQLDAANARIAALAREDPLTGLANRRTFLDHLDRTFRERGRDGAGFAVLFLDLDGFKDINDTLGHAAGDALIIEVAGRLQRSVRQDDIVARFGGDEFAVLQRGVRGAGDAGTLAEKIREAVARPFAVGHDTIRVTSSIGIALAGDNSASPTDLLVRADLALYCAKDDGRNRFSFHDSRLDQQVHTRVLLARELQTAIARGELELLYRPQVCIATGRVVGLETRVQWNHPARGVIKPSVFIPIAERAGMIIAVNDWVMEEAAHQLRQWQDHGIAPPILAVDISAGQLKAASDLAAGLRTCLDKHGIAPDRIELEVDEPVLMQAATRHAATLEALRAAGFRMSITDFGNGYSCIGYLARAPVQRLKIPRSLVAGALANASCARAVRATVQIARELGAETVADGVETQAQAVFLLAAGCEHAQGPFFGPTLTAMEATLLLRTAAVEAATSSTVRSSSAA